MKKIILFSSIIAAFLLMTSCMGESETSYSEVPLAYITTSEQGVRYAQTMGYYGLPITSPEVKLETPGKFVFVAYSWTESQNTITEEGIYNATVADISDPIEQTYLFSEDAPELEDELPLEAFKQALPYLGANFDHHWIWAYSYENGDGKKELKFYHNLEEASENKIIIDVRLEDGEGTIDKDQTDVLVAVNLEPIYSYYAADMSTDRKDLKVHFRYYRDNSGTIELYETQQYTMSIVKE